MDIFLNFYPEVVEDVVKIAEGRFGWYYIVSIQFFLLIHCNLKSFDGINVK